MIVVAKVGSSSVTDAQGEISHAAVDKFCAEVAVLRGQDHRVVIVTSGAIAAGLPALGLSGARPTDVNTLQAVSAVGQSRLMRVYDDILAHYGQSVGLRHARKHLGWALDAAAESSGAPDATLKSRSPTTRSASATTTDWPPSSPTWCRPTCSCC